MGGSQGLRPGGRGRLPCDPERNRATSRTNACQPRVPHPHLHAGAQFSHCAVCWNPAHRQSPQPSLCQPTLGSPNPKPAPPLHTHTPVPCHRSVLVRNGQWQATDTLSELGIYGTFVRHNDAVLVNKQVGQDHGTGWGRSPDTDPTHGLLRSLSCDLLPSLPHGHAECGALCRVCRPTVSTAHACGSECSAYTPLATLAHALIPCSTPAFPSPPHASPCSPGTWCAPRWPHPTRAAWRRGSQCWTARTWWTERQGLRQGAGEGPTQRLSTEAAKRLDVGRTAWARLAAAGRNVMGRRCTYAGDTSVVHQ